MLGCVRTVFVVISFCCLFWIGFGFNFAIFLCFADLEFGLGLMVFDSFIVNLGVRFWLVSDFGFGFVFWTWFLYLGFGAGFWVPSFRWFCVA